MLGHLATVLSSVQEEHASDELLSLMLPPSIMSTLKAGEGADMRFADSFEEACILFVEIAHFARLSALLEPADLIDLLNTVFTAFDDLVADPSIGAYKVETIGPVYMVACGVPGKSCALGIAVAFGPDLFFFSRLLVA